MKGRREENGQEERGRGKGGGGREEEEEGRMKLLPASLW